jgi:hypothetical protein
VLQGFNLLVTQQHGTQFSVLAGNTIPFPCDPIAHPPSDIVVTVESAFHTFGDTGFTKSIHIEMTGSRDDFRTWVLPHLAVGPSAGVQAAAESAAAAQGLALAGIESSGVAASDLQLSAVETRLLAPGATAEVPVEVPTTDALAVTVVAAPGVGAALLDPQGKTVQTLVANSAAARQPFAATLSAAQPAAGSWRVRLTNQGAQPAQTTVGVLLGVTPVRLAVDWPQPASGQIATLRARLLDGATPDAGATVTAVLLQPDGTQLPLTLADDGRHSDGAAGDGTFGVQLPIHDAGQSVVLVRATKGGLLRATVGTAGTAAQTPAAGRALFLPFIVR